MHEILGWSGPMTHRQYVTWQAWLNAQWNLPDRNDHYQMQTAAEIRRGNSGKKARSVKLDDFKIPFRFSRKKIAATDIPTDDDAIKRKKAAISAAARSRHMAQAKVPVRIVHASG